MPPHQYFYRDTSLEGLSANAKEDPSLREMRISPAGHQPSISWSRGIIIIIIVIIIISSSAIVVIILIIIIAIIVSFIVILLRFLSLLLWSFSHGFCFLYSLGNLFCGLVKCLYLLSKNIFCLRTIIFIVTITTSFVQFQKNSAS